jgi:hypothetical protein
MGGDMIGSSTVLIGSEQALQYPEHLLEAKERTIQESGLSERIQAQSGASKAGEAEFASKQSRASLLRLLQAHGKLPALHTLIGLEKSGTPVQVDLSRRESWHLVVDGPSGDSRSNMLRVCAAGMALSSRQSQLQYIALDPGGRELVFLESCPHMLTDLVSDWLFAEEVMQWLVGETVHRQQYRIENPHIFLWIDKMDLLYTSMSRAARKRLASLWERGPEFGIHIAVSINSEIKKFEDIFPSLASSVHISLVDHKQAHPGSTNVYRSTVSIEGKRVPFRPALFTAQEMNEAAKLLRAGSRLTGESLLKEGVSDEY